MSSAQEDFYDDGLDYLSGSPHLKHRALNRFLVAQITAAVDAALAQGLPAEVLEVGAGDGSITEPLLDRGLSVTSTDMSEASVGRMRRRFQDHAGFEGIHDPDGSLEVLEGRRFSAVVFASVLHHIPDYVTALRGTAERNLAPGGSLVSIQDPLWYPRRGRISLMLSDLAYGSWRLVQGDVLEGLMSRFRRRIGGPSEDRPSDMVEYHVVRDGVDEQAVVSCLEERFAEVELLTYWSTHGAPQQRLGEVLKLRNTFAVRATGLRPPA